ncbi:WhiB family transcriptional regulator [Rhodococcus sp. 27YEA15]|uniref:WhiB family transcriptional regulator n=1 Tax=Rhodococcus sp. 27YEA15 TaxID=3156259 RepID=UPI003C7EBAC5
MRSALGYPRPVASEWNWQLEGRCRYLNPDVFFGRNNEERGVRIRRERAAKDICDSCPVQMRCLEYAIDSGERYGVWGGTSETDRRDLLRSAKPRTTR